MKTQNIIKGKPNKNANNEFYNLYFSVVIVD